MKVSIRKYEDTPSRLKNSLSGKRHYFLDLSVEFTNEELAIIKARNLTDLASGIQSYGIVDTTWRDMRTMRPGLLSKEAWTFNRRSLSAKDVWGIMMKPNVNNMPNPYKGDLTIGDLAQFRMLRFECGTPAEADYLDNNIRACLATVKQDLLNNAVTPNSTDTFEL